MPDIFNQAGEKIADIPLSEKQTKQLEAGLSITIQYHTPQLLRNLLGSDSGSFEVHKDGTRIVAADPETAKKCAAMLQAIAVMRGKS
jgi:hypothetical protein